MVLRVWEEFDGNSRSWRFFDVSNGSSVICFDIIVVWDLGDVVSSGVIWVVIG